MEKLEFRRLVLHAPYFWPTLGKTVFNSAALDFGAPKYGWLVDLLKTGRVDFALLMDPNVTSADHFVGPLFHRLGIKDINARYRAVYDETIIWCQLNGLDYFEKIIQVDELKRGDVVFGFANQFLDNNRTNHSDHDNILEAAMAKSKEGVYCLLHLSHFIFGIKHLARKLINAKNCIYVHEMPLHELPFFKKHFGDQIFVHTLPWVVQERFYRAERDKDAEQRILVLGGISPQTLSDQTSEIFLEYGCENLAPNRHILFKYRNNLSRYFDFSSVDAYGDVVKKVQKYSDEIITEWLALVSTRRPFEYEPPFSFPIDNAAKLRKNLFSYAEHEITGIPTISFFEALAAGSTLISTDGWVERVYGLTSGKNYLKFEGNINSLVKTAAKFAENSELHDLIFSSNSSLSQKWSKQVVQDRFVSILNR